MFFKNSECIVYKCTFTLPASNKLMGNHIHVTTSSIARISDYSIGNSFGIATCYVLDGPGLESL
jgi:hypothetical protein